MIQQQIKIPFWGDKTTEEPKYWMEEIDDRDFEELQTEIEKSKVNSFSPLQSEIILVSGSQRSRHSVTV